MYRRFKEIVVNFLTVGVFPVILVLVFVGLVFVVGVRVEVAS